MCHFKDSLWEKGSFDEKEEITLLPNNLFCVADCRGNAPSPIEG